VVEAEETEDYYEVRLSYRPAHGFGGHPGIEQITIDNSGTIEIRRIVSQSRLARHRRRSPIAIVLAVAGAAIGGLSASGALTSNAPPPLITSVALTPDSPVRLVSLNGDVTIDLGTNRG